LGLSLADFELRLSTWADTQENPVETVEGLMDERCVTGKYVLCVHVGEGTEEDRTPLFSSYQIIHWEL